MILIRKLKSEEEKIALENFKDYDIIDNGISESSYFVLEDDSKIEGICNFVVNNDKYVLINYIIIKEDRRGEKLGDSILRALLNYCLNRGINKAYYQGTCEYLVKKGFKKSDIEINQFKDYLNNDKYVILECDIEEFFSKGCCSRS